MRDAIEKRFSVRGYTGESLDGEKIEKIKFLINKYNEQSGLDIQFVEDGSKAFDSARKTYGMFRNVRSVIVFKGKAELEHLDEKAGFYGEALLLDLVDMGLGTCWVGGTFDKESFSCPENERIVIVMTVGEYQKQNMKEKFILAQLHKKRKAWETRIDADTDIPDWVKEGIEAVVLAPSAVNSQKPHFNYRNGELSVNIPDDHSMTKVDLGIAKYHFTCTSGGSFAWGSNAVYTK